MQYFSFDVTQYRAATSYLSNEEDICYRRLLDIYYDSERPLPNDPRSLSRQARVSHAVVEDILREFFVLIDGFWHNKRADEEILGFYKRSEIASEKANRRWAKHRENAAALQQHCSGNAAAMLGVCRDDATSTSTTTKPKTSSSSGDDGPAGFAEFWAAYPRKAGKAEARKSWVKLKVNGSLPKVLAAVAEQKRSDQWLKDGGQFIPFPATWLNQGRWEDEVAATPAQSSGSLFGKGRVL